MAFSLGVPESVAGAPIARRLAWVTAARLGVLTLSLGALGLLALSRGVAIESKTVQIIVVTIAAAFALTVGYSIVLRTGRHLTALAGAQLICDQAVFTVLVYLTGGAASGATSFYGLTSLVGAFLAGFGGAAIAGVAAAVCYVAVVLALSSGWIVPPSDEVLDLYSLTSEERTYYLTVNLLVIVVVTLLASNLSERLSRAGGRIVAAEERADAAERMAALGRLAAGLAHEIRNPLSSISSSVQLLRTSHVLTEEDRELCDIVQRETARLNELVTDMMNVSKPQKPQPIPVDVAAIAGEVVQLAARSGRAASDVRVTLEGPNDGARVVRADPAQLRQLIWNLVRNAVQASSAGDTVRVSIADGPNATVVLSVADDGVGLDEEAKERLFDAFFTTRSHGTGIGLAVVKRIADEHGFAISVDSERGRGATFRVMLGERLDEPAALANVRWSPSVPPP